MKRLLSLCLVVFMALAVPMVVPYFMPVAHAVSSTFAAAGVSSTLFVPHGQKVRLSLTGTWVATVNVEESNNGGASYFNLFPNTANISTDIDSKPYDRLIRLNCISYTSGTVTYVFTGITYPTGRYRYYTVGDGGIGSVAYGSLGTSTTPVTGTWYYADLLLPVNFTSTGAAPLNAATVGTNKWVCALLDGSGLVLGNTATAGATTSGANAFQEIAWLAPLQLTPGEYYVACQLDGTTDRFRTIAASTFGHVLTGSTTGAFGTVPVSFTPPTSQTADKGPIAYIY